MANIRSEALFWNFIFPDLDRFLGLAPLHLDGILTFRGKLGQGYQSITTRHLYILSDILLLGGVEANRKVVNHQLKTQLYVTVLIFVEVRQF